MKSKSKKACLFNKAHVLTHKKKLRLTNQKKKKKAHALDSEVLKPMSGCALSRAFKTMMNTWTKELKFLSCIFLGIGLHNILRIVLSHC